MNILIAGGFYSIRGYIVLSLIEQGKNLITLDDLSNSSSNAIEIHNFFLMIILQINSITMICKLQP